MESEDQELGSPAQGRSGGVDARSHALRIEHLSKTFPGQRALDDVSIDIRSGEIHALVGQNGSGKSTLIKTLSGFHKPDPGAQAWLGAEEITLGTPSEEDKARLKFVHQDVALVPTLTVRENLGLEKSKRGMLAPFDRRAERKATRALLATFDLSIDPETIVGKLAPFEKAAVAIVRAVGSVDEGVQLLVLDEPTASLGALEVTQLFSTLRRANEVGVAILYVSHFLPEVLSIAERITVLRDGRRVTTVDSADVDEQKLVELMVGHSIEHARPPSRNADAGAPPLALRDLSCAPLQHCSFEVHHGEVVGITGLVGSGFERVAQCLAGSHPWQGGEVEINGTTFSSLTPRTAVAGGLACMPEDRRGLGLIPNFTLAENVTLPDIGDAWKGGIIRKSMEMRDVGVWLSTTGVNPPDPGKLVSELSGGNQQKVMLAKALRLQPDVVVLAEPTQAVDVAASASIRQLISDLAQNGRAVLIASTDAEELEQICQRVLIVRNGRLACELVGTDISEDRILFESQFEAAAAATTVPEGGAS